MGIIFHLVVSLIILIPCWKILSKAGMTPALSLLILIPYLGFPLVAFILAFGRWPNAGPADAALDRVGGN